VSEVDFNVMAPDVEKVAAPEVPKSKVHAFSLSPETDAFVPDQYGSEFTL
jgi:hypothetical protein